MSKRKLTLEQARFLGDQLRLVDFEYTLANEPLKFVKNLTRNFRLYIPFNLITIPSRYHQDKRVPVHSPQFQKQEVYQGRGGSCLINNPFMVDFLRSLDFSSRHLQGCIVKPSLQRDIFHAGVLVTDFETKGDAYHLDVGTFIPMMRVTKVEESGDFAGPVHQDVGLQYQVVGFKRLLETLDADPDRFSEESKAIIMRFRDEIKNGSGFVVMYSINSFIKNHVKQLRSQQDGTWSLYLLYDKLTPFRFDVVGRLLGDGSVPLPFRLGPSAQFRTISGFGAKSGDYFLINERTITQCLGSSHKNLDTDDDMIITSSTLETREAESDDEVLALVASEFPTLVDSLLDSIKFFKEVVPTLKPPTKEQTEMFTTLMAKVANAS